jgi:hypothetical protein
VVEEVEVESPGGWSRTAQQVGVEAVQRQGFALVINHLNPVDAEGADRIPPESVGGSSVKEPSVLITFFDATNLPSLLPKGSLCLDGASKGSPGVISKQHLAICKRTGLLEEIQ